MLEGIIKEIDNQLNPYNLHTELIFETQSHSYTAKLIVNYKNKIYHLGRANVSFSGGVREPRKLVEEALYESLKADNIAEGYHKEYKNDLGETIRYYNMKDFLKLLTK